MKIYINRQPIALAVAPWGGGSKVLRSIDKALRDAGHTVVYAPQNDVDIIFCFDPRKGAQPENLDYSELLRYSQYLKCPIIQRVGDVGTHSKPDLTELVAKTVPLSNAVVFISDWAKDFVLNRLQKKHNLTKLLDDEVIPVAPEHIFYEHRKAQAQTTMLPTKLSFITHHWSDNMKKGYAFYEELDASMHDGHSFTFIGRKPERIKLSKHIGPLGHDVLAEKLSKYDVYVTASEEEAGGNHVAEAKAIGLPTIYSSKGGAIREYCADYGVEFDGTVQSFWSAVRRLRDEHEDIMKNLRTYTVTVDDLSADYVKLIQRLHTVWQSMQRR